MSDPVPATLVRFRLCKNEFSVVLDTQDGLWQADVGVAAHSAKALAYICALYGHSDGCACSADPSVGLLMRALDERPSLVIRTGATPSFWLAVKGNHTWLTLDLAEATSLLLSRKVPVMLWRDQPTDWDAALRDLLDNDA